MERAELTHYINNQVNGNSILRIAGYPCCGKTVLSNLLQMYSDRCVVLEAEHWIYPLKERIRNGLSGSNSSSYNIKKCVDDLNELLINKQIKVGNYSHHEGDHTSQKDISLNNKSLIILDGTIFSLSEFDCFSDLCFNIIPEDIELWLKHAIQRDLNERFFSVEEAINHNKRKLADMKKLNNSVLCKFVKCLHLEEFKYSLGEN